MNIFSRLFSGIMGRRRAPPSVPDGGCVYAIGDIHGRLDLLERLLDQIWTDAPQAANTLVFVGDYVDRGPSSKDVIDLLIKLERPGWDIVKLRGNHEQVMLEYLNDPGSYQAWRNFGGAETLLSYGVRPPMFSDAKELGRARDEFAAALPDAHRAFLVGLSNFHVFGDYCFAHAGIRPGVSLDRQVPEDLLWIRDEFLLSDQCFDKVVVHGHSPSERPVLRANRIGIDTGAYATDCLTAVKLERSSCTFLSTKDT